MKNLSTHNISHGMQGNTTMPSNTAENCTRAEGILNNERGAANELSKLIDRVTNLRDNLNGGANPADNPQNGLSPHPIATGFLAMLEDQQQTVCQQLCILGNLFRDIECNF